MEQAFKELWSLALNAGPFAVAFLLWQNWKQDAKIERYEAWMQQQWDLKDKLTERVVTALNSSAAAAQEVRQALEPLVRRDVQR